MAAKHPGWTTGIAWLLQITIGGLLLQTLYFKLIYAPQTQVIFEPIGGRAIATLTALAELLTAGLLLLPASMVSRIDASCACSAREIRGWGDIWGWAGFANVLGVVMALGVIGGAIATHLFVIGVDIPVAPGSQTTDGGSLFAMALGIAGAAAVVLFIRWREANAFIHAVMNVAKSVPKPATA